MAAAVACAAYLWWRDRRAGLTFLATLGGVGLAAAVGAHLAWGRGFWWSVLVGPSQRFDWSQYRDLWAFLAVQKSYVFLALVVGVLAPRDVLAARRGATGPATPFAVYLPLVLAMLLLTMGKQGAWFNYFLEPTLAGLGYLVARLDRLPPTWLWNPRLALVPLLGFALFVVDYVTVPSSRYAFTTPDRNASRRDFFQSPTRSSPVCRVGPNGSCSPRPSSRTPR